MPTKMSVQVIKQNPAIAFRSKYEAVNANANQMFYESLFS
jgi:hypothetical protein